MANLFQSQQPHSDLLKKQIAYYYFDKCDDKCATRSFFYYPHYKNALTIYKNSHVLFENDYSTVTKPSKNEYFFGFAKLVNHAAKAVIEPPFDKIGVVFQPIGLNHFLEKPLSEYVTKPITLQFNYFKDSMQSVLDEVYETKDLTKKVELLDAYFLSKYQGFNEKKLEEAIELLFAQDGKYTVEELAQELNIHRKKLLRMFKKHQNSSVIDYIKLVQFRNAIDSFQNKTQKSSLTNLAYGTSYYDQSDFINHFKKLTGFNPKSFFKSISNIGNQGTYWTIK
jgi:AraC-like DNA-binding protein